MKKVLKIILLYALLSSGVMYLSCSDVTEGESESTTEVNETIDDSSRHCFNGHHGDAIGHSYGHRKNGGHSGASRP